MLTGEGFHEACVSALRTQDAALSKQEEALVLASVQGGLDFRMLRDR